MGCRWCLYIRAMKPLVALLMLVTGVSAGQERRPAEALQWANVSAHYRRFQEIKPRLINKSKVSIFLSRLWPDGLARLERFNHDRGQWESGDWGITCGVVARATVPIEIKAGSYTAIGVYWQLSTDNWERPKHFIVFGTLQQRPIEGHYRFILRYSLEPWTLVHHPSRIYYLASPEFDLNTHRSL